MATDYKTLFSSSVEYLSTGNVSGLQALKLALLKQIALSVNPMAATDVQSLLSSSDVKGYSGASNSSVADLLELALLNIIANNISGGGGGGGVTAANYGGAQPSFTPATDGAVAIDTSTGQIWWWFNGVWQ